MRLAKFKQSPLENRRYYVDYSQWLDTNEMLTGVPVLNVIGVTSPPLVIGSAAYSPDNAGLLFFVSGGRDGEEYQVDLLVTTTAGQVKEDSLIYIIEDPDI